MVSGAMQEQPMICVERGAESAGRSGRNVNRSSVCAANGQKWEGEKNWWGWAFARRSFLGAAAAFLRMRDLQDPFLKLEKDGAGVFSCLQKCPGVTEDWPGVFWPG